MKTMFTGANEFYPTKVRNAGVFNIPTPSTYKVLDANRVENVNNFSIHFVLFVKCELFSVTGFS